MAVNGKRPGMKEIIGGIGGLDEEAMARAQARLDILTKPPGSLGALEELVVQLAGISGQPIPTLAGKDKVVIVMAGDHGVVVEGVSAFPQEVTRQMVLNLASGGAGINVLARHAGVRVVVVNIGVAAELSHPRVVDRRVAPGTRNMVKGPAMSREEAIQAITAGVETTLEQIEDGAGVIATGEMGIGNTTASTAILGVCSGHRPIDLVGPGTGLPREKLASKAGIIDRALQLNNPDPGDGLDVLAKVGGFEIAGMVGCMLAAAWSRVPVIVDGLISGAAALIAARLAPQSRQYMIASHVSAEPGHRLMLQLLGLRPLLHLGMRLGEGTGAVLAINILEAATKIQAEMATFAEAGVSGAVE